MLIIIISSVLTLVSCGNSDLFGNYHLERNDKYNSHEEFLKFVEKYNSKNDGEVYSFISFDFDTSDAVQYKCYRWFMLAKLNKYIDDMIFDKYQGDSLGLEFVFGVNDSKVGAGAEQNAYQIVCCGILGHQRIKISSDDVLSFENPSETDSAHDRKYYNSYSYNFYNPDKLSYNYVASYDLCVNGEYYMSVIIAALREDVSAEKQNELCQLLLDNIVIINTEG